MADEKKDQKKPIDSVTTFVAELPGLPLEKALEKFTGRRTLRTVQAARRIAAKKRQVKLPRNLLRQLFRLTGGWKEDALKVESAFQPKEGETYYVSKIGDMDVIAQDHGGYGPAIWIRFRNAQVAKIEYYSNWLDGKRANEFFRAMGTPMVLMPKK